MYVRRLLAEMVFVTKEKVARAAPEIVRHFVITVTAGVPAALKIVTMRRQIVLFVQLHSAGIRAVMQPRIVPIVYRIVQANAIAATGFALPKKIMLFVLGIAMIMGHGFLPR